MFGMQAERVLRLKAATDAEDAKMSRSNQLLYGHRLAGCSRVGSCNSILWACYAATAAGADFKQIAVGACWPQQLKFTSCTLQDLAHLEQLRLSALLDCLRDLKQHLSNGLFQGGQGKEQAKNKQEALVASKRKL